MASKTSTALKNELANAMEYNGGLKNIGQAQKNFVDSSRMLMSNTVSVTSASANIDSGAMTIPAKSIITSVNATVTDTITLDSATTGVSYGTGSAGSVSITGTLDADSMTKTATTIQKGVTASSTAELRADASGSANLSLVLPVLTSSNTVSKPNIYIDSETDIHGRVKASAGGFKTGEVCFWVEYIILT